MKTFLDEFVYAQGKQEVPFDFLTWAGISLIAACLSDRVYYKKFRASKLLPNMYVVLIGPSGLGKGVAIDAALNVLGSVPACKDYVNDFRGKATAPHLIDYLSARSKPHSEEDKIAGKAHDPGAPNRLYLITPELSMSVGSGPIADMFVKLLTELYTGGDYVFQEGTRTSGARVLRCPIINWLGGTTEDWLVSSVTKDAITGGFFARSVAVCGDYDMGRRVYRPTYPRDYVEVMTRLGESIQWFCTLRGEYQMTEKADAILEHWYNTREVPEDELLMPTWRREHDLIIKLSMILCANEYQQDMKIRSRHIIEAQRLARSVTKNIPYLITLASITPERESILFVSRTIHTAHEIWLDQIYREGVRHGLNKRRILEVVESLIASGDVEKTSEKGREKVCWKSNRRI
jgi:hypothetical protein